MNRYLRCHPFCDGATDPTIADRYPSPRYLAPGELMLDTLLVEVEAESTIDGEPTESLATAVIVGPKDNGLNVWVEVYRRLRSAIIERSR